ncbi:MAG: HEAT repeat domain-containing protein [Planctomycetota bacterium]|nr:HEAT repeat domain-containing protein [Planctomycetota bacterium]
MAKQTVNFALAVTAIVFSIGTLLFTLGGSSGSTPDSDLGFDVRQLEERLALLETQLDKVKKQPPRTVRAKRNSPDGEGDKTPRQVQEEEAPEDQPVPPGTNEEALAMRVSGLQTRIEALESDPIQRGFRYLDSDSVKLRTEGVKALEELARSDPEALAAIQDMMNDPSEDVRWWSIDTLADINSKESIPLLMNMLNDSSEKVRREAINSLGRMGADAGPQVAGFLDSQDPETRAYAIDALGKMKYAGATEALIASLDDQNGRVRSEAIWSLAETGAKSAAPALRKIYNENPGDNRYSLVRCLKTLGDNEPFNAEFKRLSTQALESEDQNKRTEAIRSLTYFAKSEAKGIFEQLQKDPNKRVRDYAGWALRNDSRRRR